MVYLFLYAFGYFCLGDKLFSPLEQGVHRRIVFSKISYKELSFREYMYLIFITLYYDILRVFFIRGSGGGGKKEQAAPEAEAPKEIVFKQDMTVKEDQTYIYAEGSGDHNPIHIDVDFAKSVGFPGIILQGLCTMAFSSKAAYDELAGGDSTKIKRIKVRFSKPVFPGDTVTTEGWVIEKKDDVTIYGYEVKNQSGDQVIKNGVVEIAN